jgi:hypothetical protein
MWQINKSAQGMRVLLLDSDFKKWLWIPTAVTIMIIVININNKTSVHIENITGTHIKL